MDPIARIDQVINELQKIEIKSTYNNMNSLLASIQVLAGVKADLQKMNEAKADSKEEDDHDGIGADRE